MKLSKVNQYLTLCYPITVAEEQQFILTVWVIFPTWHGPIFPGMSRNNTRPRAERGCDIPAHFTPQG